MTDNNRFSKADIIRIICSRHRYPINRLINLYWYYQQVLLWLRHNAYFLNPNTYIMYYTRIFNILNTPLLQVNYINKKLVFYTSTVKVCQLIVAPLLKDDVSFTRDNAECEVNLSHTNIAHVWHMKPSGKYIQHSPCALHINKQAGLSATWCFSGG